MSGVAKLAIAILVAGVLVAGLLLPYSIGLGLASNQVADAIESAPSDPMDEQAPQRTTISDDTGKAIAYLYDQNRVDVPLSDISQYLRLAVISIEDRRFLQHKGVDWRGMVRALLKNSSDNGAVQGASTLTQQYVKNYLFLVKAKTDADRADAIAVTPIRKLREAKLALALENGPNKLSKNQILERYLNLVAFGPSTYGAEAASLRYFGVHASELTLPQAALLAGMVNNPNKFNPLNQDHAVDARNRRDLVLDAMARTGAISQGKADEAKKTNLDLNPQATPNGCINAPGSTTNGYFCQYVLDYLEQAGFTEAQLAEGGYTIRTTMDPNAMKDAKAAVNAQADPGSTTSKRVANVMAIVEPGLTTRRVLALAANRPYGLKASQGQTVLRLTTTFAPLGAGSTFKIFTAAAAMEQGLGTETTIGVPGTYRSSLVPTHEFKNSGSYPDSMTLADALATSPNTAFVRLEDQIGLGKVADMSVRLGMKGYLLDAGDVDPAFSGTGTDYEAQITQQKMASFTLGVSPVSPLELANVGATLKSDGQWCPPTPVESITDIAGKLLTWKQQECQKAVEPDLAHTLTVAMEGDLTEDGGTSHAAATAAGWDRIAAGKTGTTQDYKSSAYLGFTPQYSGAVITWDYQPRPQPICKNPLRTCTTADAQGGQGMSGGSVPAATWLAAMKPLHAGLPNADFSPPSPQYLTGAPQAQVPSVVGLAVDQASEQIKAKGFQVKVVLDDKTGAAANTVVDQDPKDNALPGTQVTLTVATGGSTGAESLPGGTTAAPPGNGGGG